MELKLFTALISALFGALVGFLAKSHFSRLKFKQTMTEAVVTRYLDARDKLSEIIATCAVNAKPEDEQWLSQKEQALAQTYYTHYDYLPKEVIQELLCLQFCLKSKNNQLYQIKNGELFKVEDGDIESFCHSISTCKNLAFSLYFNLHNGSEMRIRQHQIEYQARHALLNINQYFTEQNLTSLTLFKPKEK